MACLIGRSCGTELAQCSGRFRGSPTSGRSARSTGLATFGARSRLPQVGAAFTAFSWEALPRGEAFRAPSWRRSPRVAPPTDKACHSYKVAPRTYCFCGRPDLGAKLFGHRVGAVRRGSRLPQGKACHSHEVAPCTYCFLREARPRGEAFRAPSWRRSPQVAPPTGQSVPLARSGAMHLLLFVGGPTPGRSFSGTGLAPFAAGLASHRTWPLAGKPTTRWRAENSLPGKPSHFRP